VSIFFQNVQSLETALEGCPDPSAGRVIIIVAGGGGGQIGGGDLGEGGKGFGDDENKPPQCQVNPTTTTTAPPCTLLNGGVPEAKPVTICYQVRDGAGVPVDLDPYNPTLWDIDGCCRLDGAMYPHVVYQRLGCTSAGKSKGDLIFPTPGKDGNLCMTVPSAISNCPGIYRAGIVLTDKAGNVAFYTEFLLSVEPSLLANSCGCNGPLTISQVRMKLRDFAGENDAWDAIEFSDAEIINAMTLPINHFNGTTPLGVTFDTCSWPQIWQSRWLDATVAQLMLTAAYNYMRNARNIQTAGGVTEDRNQRWKAYMSLSQGVWQEFQLWAKATKATMNWNGGFGTLGGTSPLY